MVCKVIKDIRLIYIIFYNLIEHGSLYIVGTATLVILVMEILWISLDLIMMNAIIHVITEEETDK